MKNARSYKITHFTPQELFSGVTQDLLVGPLFGFPRGIVIVHQ
jgi:hypothetical protein